MDPASITGLIGFSLDSIILIYKYLTAVKNASRTVSQLQDELDQLKDSLEMVEALLKEDQLATALRQTSALFKAVKKCSGDLKDLQHKLDGIFKGSFVRRTFHILKWPLDEGETSGILNSLHRYLTVFQLSLTAEGFSILCGSTADVQKRLESLDLSEEEYARFLDWLPTLDYQERHLDIESRRLEGSGNWLLDGPEFRSWSDGTSTETTLFCHGGPGVGKTFLTSLVIDRLQDMCEVSGGKLAYLYFDYKKQSEQTPVRVVSCLLKQILSVYRSAPDAARDLFGRFKKRLALPQWSELLGIFVNICSNVASGPHYVVVDALDECSEGGNRGQVLRILKDLRAANVRLFATSRPYPDDIMHTLFGATVIEVGASSADLYKYLTGKIAEATWLPSGIKDKFVQEVIETIIGKAQGMFLLASMQVDFVLGQSNIKGMRKALELLPLGLWANFKLTLDRIRALPHHSQRDLALRTLLWISHSFRPLTVKELQQAIGLDVRSRTVDEDDITPKVLLVKYCCGLVTVDEGTSIIRMAHYSIYEYFQQQEQQPLLGRGHVDMTHVCLSYLMMDPFVAGPCSDKASLDKRREGLPLAEYAAQHWGDHAAKCAVEEIREWVEEFVRSPNSISSWSQLALQSLESLTTEGLIRSGITPLHVVSRFGLLDLVKSSTSDVIGDNFNGKTSFGETPLIFASANGQAEFIRFLMNKKHSVSINDTDCTGRSALNWAVERHHTAVVQALLASPNLDVNFGAPLVDSVKAKDDSICRVLVQRQDLDINAVNVMGETALTEAFQVLDLAIINTLTSRVDLDPRKVHLDRQISGLADDEDIMTNEEFETYPKIIRRMSEFCWRRARIHEGDVYLRWFMDWLCGTSMVGAHIDKMLEWLDDDFDISMIDEEGFTFLHLAAALGNEDLARRALDSGICADAMSKSQETPLHIATRTTDESGAVISLLLGRSNELDLDTPDQDGSTALHNAAAASKEDACRLLLTLGARLDVVDKLGQTSLYSAISANTSTILRMLLDAGADPNNANNRGESVLLWAIWEGKVEECILLLEHGASVHVGGARGFSALHAAAYRGENRIAKLLLNRGADVAHKSLLSGTPLDLAAAEMNAPLVAMFISSSGGTRLVPTEIGLFGRTALDWAAQYPPVFDAMGSNWTEVYRPTSNSERARALRKAMRTAIAEMLDGTPRYTSYGFLGHILLFLGNRDAALRAFEEAASMENETAIHSGLVCKVCTNAIQGFRFVCVECANVNLCSQCFIQHPACNRPFGPVSKCRAPGDVTEDNAPPATVEELVASKWHKQLLQRRGKETDAKDCAVVAEKIPWCKASHTYLRVPGDEWIQREGAPKEGDQEADKERWLRDLKAMYDCVQS